MHTVFWLLYFLVVGLNPGTAAFGDKVREVNFPKIESRSIDVAWNHPAKPNGVIDSYRVETTDVKSGSQIVRKMARTKTTLSVLSPYTTYSISIWTVCLPDPDSTLGGGEGEAVTITLTTPPLAGQNVTDIQVTHIGTDTVTVTWKAPEQPQGEIQSYHVTATNTETNDQQTSETTSTETTLSNLRPYVNYEISVSTENKQLNGKGGGVGQPVVEQIRTLPLVGQKVREVGFPKIEPRSISVEWKPPTKPYGVIKSYRIQTTDVETGSEIVREMLLTETTLSDLSPYTTYNISVWTVNLPDLDSKLGGGAGEAVAITLTTPPLAGQNVTDIQVTHIGANTVTVTWKAPEQPQGEIQSYHVTFWNLNTGEKLMSETTSTQTTLSHMIPHTPYEISVSTENKHLNGYGGGDGLPVVKQIMTLKLEPPASPNVDTVQ